jgi:hypothetical protein
MATSRLKLTPGLAYLYDGTEGIYQIVTGQAQALTGDDKVVASGSLQVTGSVFLQNQASAPTPGGAEAVLYARAGTLYFKNSGGSETAVGGGGGGSPGGSSTQVQFNDGGSSFGGDAGLTYVKGTDTLNVTNVSMTATADQTWNLIDNSAGALNISAGSTNNRWTFNTGDGQERLGFWDNVKAGFGDINDPDLTIYHDGTDSLIKNKTGQLVISGNNGVYMTGSLALSGSLTLVGDIVADRNTPRNVLTDVASITLGGAASTVTVAGDLAVNGGDITTTASTFNIANANATTVSVGGAATSVSLGTTTGAAWLKNANVYFSGSVYVSGSTRLGDAAGDVTQVTGSFRSRQVTGSIYTVDGTTTFLKDGTNVTTTYDNATGQWTISSTGGGGGTPGGSSTQVQFNDGGSAFGGDSGLTYDKDTDTLTVGGDVAVNGGDITTSASTFNLVNANATTLSIGGAATNVSLGTTTGAAWLKNANVYFSGSVYVSGSTKLGDAAADITEVTGSFKSRHITGSIHTVDGSTPFITGSGASVTFSNAAGQWTVSAGDVIGPASSLDNQVARFDSTTGKLIQSSSITISDVSAGLVTLDTPGSATSVNLFTSNATTMTIGKSDANGSATVRLKLTANERLTYNDELFAGSGVLDRTASTQNSADLNGYRYVRFAGLSGNVICHVPAASTATGRVITILNGTAVTHKVQISSEGGNIVGLGAASTSYYLAAAGYWAELLSNGTDWVIVCGGLLPTSSN